MADTELLMDAVSAGRLEEVKRLISQGADGQTALKYAAVFERVGIARFLLGQGAAEARDQDGKTALINAAEAGRLRVVKFLVELGVDKEAKSKDGKTALLWATVNDRLPVVTYLIEHGANKEASSRGGMTALIHAAWRGNLRVVQYLVEQGVNLEARDCDGKTALIVAAEEARLTVVKYLVQHGADRDAKDSRGKTALVYATWFGYVDVMDFLVEYDACKEARGWDGHSELTHTTTVLIDKFNGKCSAAGAAKLEMAEKISELRRYRPVDKQVLHACTHAQDASKDELKTMKSFFDKDPNGTTAIMHAARLGRLEVVKYLVEQGANLLAIDNDGNTVLHHLLASTERIKFLFTRKKRLEERILPVAKLLLEHGVPIASNNAGKLVKSIAKARGFSYLPDLVEEYELRRRVEEETFPAGHSAELETR